MSSIDLKNSRILITNDDGFFSPGIDILKSIAETFSNDIWIVAPEFEKSGASHALSFTSDLNLKKHDEFIENVTFANPGFINITFKPIFWTNFIEKIINNSKTFGVNQNEKKNNLSFTISHIF